MPISGPSVQKHARVFAKKTEMQFRASNSLMENLENRY